MTYTARTDFESVPISKLPTIPEIGSVAHDPDFNASILRVTGPGFDASRPGFAYMAGLGGSADVCAWSSDGKLFTFEDSGSRHYVLQFDPAKMKTSPLYPDAFPTSTFHTDAAVEFSRLNSHLLFQFDRTKIGTFDFSSKTSVPVVTPFFDFAPFVGFVPLWQSVGGLSADDKTFAVAYSAGAQGTGSTILVHQVGKGWRKFDTMTGLVTGQYGVFGTIKNSNRFLIHNVKLSPSGKYLVITPSAIDGKPTFDKHFWNINTLEMEMVENSTGGHFTTGYRTWINNGGIPFGQYQKRPLSAPASASPIISPMPTTKQVPVFDSHLSWSNVGPDDSQPFFATTTSTNDIWQLWQHEVLGFSGGKVYRFCHTFNTGKSPLFSIANELGCVSQNGEFMLFCSDWMGECKGDVFIVALK